MALTCCLAGVDRTLIPMFSAIVAGAGARAPVSLAGLDVSELGRLAPGLLVCDIDSAKVDALELLRQIRFVLPDCVIAVYTGKIARNWAVACHLAGANCLLSKDTNERMLSLGVRSALRSGCYTDPGFAAA